MESAAKRSIKEGRSDSFASRINNSCEGNAFYLNLCLRLRADWRCQMAATKTYTFEYFMPDIHLKTALLTFSTVLFGFIYQVAKGGAGSHLILFLAFSASVLFAFFGFYRITSWTQKTVLVVS